MTQFQRLARGAALAAAAVCTFASALGGLSTASEAKKPKPAPQQSAQQGAQPAPASQDDEASQKAAAAAAAHKAYDAGLKEFANGRMQGAVDQLSAAVKAGGLTPPEMAKALYTRGVAYKKLNKPSLAISDLTSALWLKNGLSDSDRDAATRERAESYRMAGLAESSGVPDRPVVAQATPGPNTDSAGLSPKAIAEAATTAGKSGGPAQPITRQDPTSEAAQDAARARAAYAGNDSSLPSAAASSAAASSAGTGTANAPAVQSATVGPTAWSTSAKVSALPATKFAPPPNTPPAPVKVSGTFTLLKPAPEASSKAATTPSVVAMKEAKAPPAQIPAVAPPATVAWAQPYVQPAPASPAPTSAAPAKAYVAATAAAPQPVAAPPSPAVSTWTAPAAPASPDAPPSTYASVPEGPKSAPVQSSPAQSSAAMASIWTPPAQPASAPAVVPAPAPAPATETAPPEDQRQVSVPMTTAGYISSLFASDMPTPPPPRKVSFTTGSTDPVEPETSSWSDSKEPTAKKAAKTADKKSKANTKSILAVTDTGAAPSSKAGKYKVHIAALRSRAEAEALAQKLVTEHAADLSNHIPTVDETVIGSMGTFYRVRILGYASQDEPRGLCNKLRTSGLDCLVVTN